MTRAVLYAAFLLGLGILIGASGMFAHPAPAATQADPAPLISQLQEARKDRIRVRAKRCLSRPVFKQPAWMIRAGLRHWAVHSHRWKLARDLEREARCNPIAPPATKELAKRMAAQRGWTGYQWDALEVLWQRESQWHACRHYPSTTNCNYSGNAACGLPQFVPCSKLLNDCLGAGRDAWNLGSCPSSVQIRKGLDYIAARHGSPAGALAHSNANNWY